MGEIVEVDVGGGNLVHVEVSQVLGGGHGGAGVGGDAGPRRLAAEALEQLPMQLEPVQGLIRDMGQWAVGAVESIPARRPDQFEIEFGFKLAAKSGRLVGVIAEAGAEASFTVRMSWRLRSERGDSGKPDGRSDERDESNP